MTGAEIIVQASSGGMAGHAPLSRPVLEALDQAHPDASAVEMVYHPLETPFLRRTGELNFLISDGLDMLISQAAEAFRLFFGAAAPDRHYRDLRALLTS
jgi:shikimate dehydrogenase